MPQLWRSLGSCWMVGVALVLGAACQSDSPSITYSEPPAVPPPPPPPAPVHASLGILAISPAEGTVLAAAAPAEFSATLAYDFGTSGGGEIVVAIICTRNGALTCVDAGILATVATGTGTREVSVRLRPVPARSTIELVFMLHPLDATAPVASKTVKYQSGL